MNITQQNTLAASNETGSTGIFHLKRLWGKAMHAETQRYPDEAALDSALLDALGIGLLPAYQFLHEQRPGFDQFEAWVIQQQGGSMSAETVATCNALVNKTVAGAGLLEEDVLTAEELAFWNENGYVILRQAISEEDCRAAREVIWHYLQMEENKEESWYQPNEAMQGIMLPLYRDPAIDKNRQAPRIRRAFEQIWKNKNLAVTTDKCGFNPPETTGFTYRGIGLHWDVSLARPIPFGTQGILYLTDTAAHQGALTLVPGFHKIIESWLSGLPKEVDPRNTDFSAWSPIPVAAGAGDFIIWDHRLPHSSSPNRAHAPRLVQYINWYDPLQEKQREWI